MEREAPKFELRVNGKTVLPDGTMVEALPLTAPPNTITVGGTVAIHEAQHYVAARTLSISVPNVNIIQMGSVLGTTTVAEFHPVVTAAAHAMGSPGGGSDMGKLAMLGYNETMVVEQAKALMAGKEEDVFIAASVIEERRSISGSELDIEVEKRKKERRNPETGVILVFKKPNGEVKKEKTKSENGGVIIFPDQWHKKPKFTDSQSSQSIAA